MYRHARLCSKSCLSVIFRIRSRCFSKSSFCVPMACIRFSRGNSCMASSENVFGRRNGEGCLCQHAYWRLLWGNSVIALRQRHGTREKLALDREGGRTGIRSAARPNPFDSLAKPQVVQGRSWGFLFLIRHLALSDIELTRQSDSNLDLIPGIRAVLLDQ